MQKTKFGITVGMMGAAVFFVALSGGYVAVILMAGYILLFEENAWLKRSALKSVVLLLIFAVLSSCIGFIPDVIGLLNNVFSIFGGYFNSVIINGIVNTIVSLIRILEKILFLSLGFSAISQGTIVLPGIDKIVGRCLE